jgi:hypothetical protein
MGNAAGLNQELNHRGTEDAEKTKLFSASSVPLWFNTHFGSGSGLGPVISRAARLRVK